MKGCATIQVAEILGAINRLRRAATTVINEQRRPRPEEGSPAMRELEEALQRADKVLGAVQPKG